MSVRNAPSAEPAERPPLATLELPPGVPPLSTLYLYIAGACNLACRHCWISPSFTPNGRSGRFVELELLKKAITQARPLGLKSVKLTGGEPLLHPAFEDIIRFLDAERLGVIIETNGTLIDESVVQVLRATSRLATVSVSLDGIDAATHDRLRGVSGSFERAIRGIKLLVGAGIRPQVICTLHKGNVAQVEGFVSLAQELQCGSVKFNHIEHLGRGMAFPSAECLDVAEVILLGREIDDGVRRASKIPVYQSLPIAFRTLGALLSDPLHTCGVLGILGVLGGGELALCGIGETVSKLVFGNIATDDLRDVWIGNEVLHTIRERIPWQLEGICGECIHRDGCLGVCLAMNFVDSGELFGAHTFCRHADELGLFPSSRRTARKRG